MGKTKDVSHQELMEVINSFDFGGKLEEVGIFGNGHINETYCACLLYTSDAADD